MDWKHMMKVLASLLSVTLHVISGFSITGLSNNNRRALQARQIEDDLVNEIVDNFRFADSLADAPDIDDGHTIPSSKAVDLLGIPFKRHSLWYKRGVTTGENNNYGYNLESEIPPEMMDKQNDWLPEIRASVAPDIDDGHTIPSSKGVDLFGIPFKRQQGWYVGYGKRGVTTGENDNYGYSLESEIPREMVDKQNDWLAKIRFDPDLGRHEDDGLKGVADIPSTRGDGQLFSDGHRRDALGSPVVWKRQQGWYVQYGKRSHKSDNLLS